MVLRVSDHSRVRFSDAAKFAFPIAVEHDPIDMVLRRRTACLPAVPARRVELRVVGGAVRVVGIGQRLDRTITYELAVDGRDDPVTGHIRKHFVFKLSGIRTAGAYQIAIEPLLRDALELPEEVKFRVFARVAPLVQDKMRCQLIQYLRRTNVAGMN